MIRYGIQLNIMFGHNETASSASFPHVSVSVVRSSANYIESLFGNGVSDRKSAPSGGDLEFLATGPRHPYAKADPQPRAFDRRRGYGTR